MMVLRTVSEVRKNHRDFYRQIAIVVKDKNCLPQHLSILVCVCVCVHVCVCVCVWERDR
jgi:hypothetical protein